MKQVWMFAQVGMFALASMALLPFQADAKPALCTIAEGGTTTFSGKCVFNSTDANGSFVIRNASGDQILTGVTDVSVTLVGDGVAEVRGVTTKGINSRWGSARRSAANPACWQGTDFEICAY